MPTRAVRSGLITALLLGTLGSVGCLGPIHSHPPCPEHRLCCEAVPGVARRHVYVFMLNGLDPCDTANLQGVREHLCHLGFTKVWLGHFYHVCQMEQEILRLFREDPAARFVVIGHGAGAGCARDLVQAVEEPGVTVDLLVYLNGLNLGRGLDSRPCNARQVLNVRGCRAFGDCDVTGAENLHVPQVGHLGLPTYWAVMDRLVEELAAVACEVEVEFPAPPTPVFTPEPTPREVAEEEPGEPDEWDFLKPSNVLPPPRVGAPASSEQP